MPETPDLAGREGPVPVVVPGRGLHHPDRRRALPVPGGPVHDVSTGAQELRLPGRWGGTGSAASWHRW